MIRKTCEECNIQFEYEPPAGYPDKRKYCYSCSEKKKASWDAKGEAPKSAENGFHLTPEKVNVESLSIAINFSELVKLNPSIDQVKEFAKQFKEWIYGN